MFCGILSSTYSEISFTPKQLHIFLCFILCCEEMSLLLLVEIFNVLCNKGKPSMGKIKKGMYFTSLKNLISMRKLESCKR